MWWKGRTKADGWPIVVKNATTKGLLTPAEAHKDKIHKRTGIEVVFTQSIIEYCIHGETCVLSNNYFVQG